MLKKITSGVLSALLLASSAMPVSSANVFAAVSPNYAEALQKSLFFYECQQAGPLPEWNRVEWKADSTMIDEVKGGWYDAGDHVKFNLPMAYSASMLAWGLYQYPDGLEKCGEMTNYVNNLEFVLDYLAECDQGKEVVFQVGNGTVDHTWWGPVELIQYGMEDSGTTYESARETFKASEGCSAVFGDMAAALAAGYLALDGRIDETKRAGYLKHAESIFKLADASKSDDVYNDSNASGFYRSSHFYDELFYASNWLYMATGNETYLEKATSYIPNLGKELGSDELKYSWGHCWDDTMQGGMLLYAINTKDDFYISRVKKHVDYWTNDVKQFEGGFRWITTWGCLRYAETAGFIAAVACDTVLKGTDTSAYEKFYKEQIDYALGVNPDNRSYVVGYGENSPQNPHHRTAHASWKNALETPTTNRHILYGALVGGPNENGSYEDDRGNYINNEVATDYNAGFTALLCKMVDEFGGETDPTFPQPEVHDGPEFYVEALSKGADSSGITVSFKITNHSAWPARVQDNISFRYYMDMSEVIALGKKPEDVVIRCDRDQSAMYAGNGVKNAEISKPIQYDGNIYYVEVNLPDGRAVLPVSEGMQQCEILLAFVMPDYGSGWDAENDFSNKDILGAKGTTDEAGTTHGIVSKYIPVYVNGELYYGEEPDGTFKDGLGSSAPTSQTTTKATTSKPADTTTKTTVVTTVKNDTDVLYGDANCDGSVTMADAVIILQSLANSSKYEITSQGKINGDVDGEAGITAMDALVIQKYDAGSVKELPIK